MTTGRIDQVAISPPTCTPVRARRRRGEQSSVAQQTRGPAELGFFLLLFAIPSQVASSADQQRGLDVASPWTETCRSSFLQGDRERTLEVARSLLPCLGYPADSHAHMCRTTLKSVASRRALFTPHRRAAAVDGPTAITWERTQAPTQARERILQWLRCASSLNATSHPPFHPLSFALCVRLHLPSQGQVAMLAAQLTRVPRTPAGRLDPGMRLDAPAPTVTAALLSRVAGAARSQTRHRFRPTVALSDDY